MLIVFWGDLDGMSLHVSSTFGNLASCRAMRIIRQYSQLVLLRCAETQLPEVYWKLNSACRSLMDRPDSDVTRIARN